MTTSVSRPVSSLRVPVSTTETARLKSETGPDPRPENKEQMTRLVGVLVHSYGWVLGQDGNLYNPDPQSLAWGERVA